MNSIELIHTKQEELEQAIKTLEQEIYDTSDRLVHLAEEYVKLTGNLPKKKLDIQGLGSQLSKVYNTMNKANQILGLFGKNIF